MTYILAIIWLEIRYKQNMNESMEHYCYNFSGVHQNKQCQQKLIRDMSFFMANVYFKLCFSKLKKTYANFYHDKVTKFVYPTTLHLSNSSTLKRPLYLYFPMPLHSCGTLSISLFLYVVQNAAYHNKHNTHLWV